MMSLSDSNSSLLSAFPLDLQTYLLNTLAKISTDVLILLSYTNTTHAKYVSVYVLTRETPLKRQISLIRLAAQGDLHLLKWMVYQIPKITIMKTTFMLNCTWRRL